MKNNLRKELLKARDSLSQDEINSLSHKAFENLKKLQEYNRSEHCLVYLDFKKEINTYEIIEDMLNRNRKIYVPISKPKTYELLISKLESYSDLEPSTYGILEPKKEKLQIVSPSILDLIIVPGVVFDRKGYRIGYGKGYYDRFLSSLKQEHTAVGYCYDLQLLDEVPRDKYDVRLDYIVTDKRIIASR